MNLTASLPGIHKEAKVFIQDGDSETQALSLNISEMCEEETKKKISESHEALKKAESKRDTIAELGEKTLKTGEGCSAPQIASQAGCLSHLADIFPQPQEGRV